MADNPTPRQPGPNAGMRADTRTAAESATGKKKRGRPAGGAVKEYPPIPTDQFAIEILDDSDRGSYRRRRLERSAQQVAVDNMVMSVYRDWKKVGAPDDWSKMPVRRWVVDKNVEETARFMLRKAAALHAKRLIFGREVTVGDKAHITFAITDRKEKPPEDGEQAAEANAGSATATAS